LTLRCLGPELAFLDSSAYLVVPVLVHRYRARGLLAAGQLDAALKEARLGLAALPGDVEVPILLAAELEKRGRKAEAEELFRPVYRVYEKVCAHYPQSAWAHNSLAWLAACCRRELDQALEHANKAVALEPDVAGLIDTLAEVHFQRGDRAKAIELMKKCVALDGKKEYFRKQLKRFEAGDPSTEVPDTGEDD
jgi:tetratricopeptide (TPR) repeat protein